MVSSNILRDFFGNNFSQTYLGPLTGKKNNYPMSSKQAGEAAMSLGFSYINALSDAIAAVNPDADFPELPATPKSVFKALSLRPDQLTI